MAYGSPIAKISRTSTTGSGTASTVTVNTEDGHPFVIGDKINIAGVLGGGAIPFSQGQPFTVLTVSGTQYSNSGSVIVGYSQLTYEQAVGTSQPGATGLGSVAIASATPVGNQNITITTSSPHNLNDKWMQIAGVTQTSGTTLTSLINIKYSKDDWRPIDGTTFQVTLRQPVSDWSPGGAALNWSGAYVLGLSLSAVVYGDDGINSKTGQVGGAGNANNWTEVLKNRTELSAVVGSLKLVANSKGMDYAFRRLVDFGDTTRIMNSIVTAEINTNLPAATWRSVLDSFVETYGGVDAKKRRYYINLDGQFVYDILDDSKPSTANAPYKIVTSTVGSPNNATSAATVNPYSLIVSYDHDTSKRALFQTSNNNGKPINDFIKFDSGDALGTTYSRPGAPYFDDVVEYPTNTGDKVSARRTAARSYFLERSSPTMSGQFTLRGSGTQTWNNLGFSSGYADVSSPTTYSLNGVSAGRFSGTLTVNTNDLHHFAAGMTVVLANYRTLSFINLSGTYTVNTVTSGTSFQCLSAGSASSYTEYLSTGDETVTGYAAFIRTGTAPNQIVTVYSPRRHGIASGAITTISGLTGTAGTSMVGTVTPTVVDDYTFTYPSTGTNGTATGIGTISSVTLVPRWEPGQWCDVSAPNLGVSGLFRVEQVDWSLEPGSFDQIITVTFNRRNYKLLTKVVSGNHWSGGGKK
jgi:hypothetical protein